MVQVDGVEGQVLYGAGDAAPSVPVQAGQRLTEGTFAAAANGILYLSTFAGSELRLAEAGTLRFYGVEEPCPMADHAARRSTFRLLGGKLQMTIRNPASPPHCYHIVLAGGGASVGSGQCVMCIHGTGTYMFVSRGATLLAGVPLQGAPREPGAMALAPERQPAAADHRRAMLAGNGKVRLARQGRRGRRPAPFRHRRRADVPPGGSSAGPGGVGKAQSSGREQASLRS